MHLVSLVRMDLVFCFGVEKKAGNLVGCFAKSVIFVFHISKNLKKVARMQCMSAVMLLCGMGIIFCVNDQYAAAKLQSDVALHDGKHGTASIVQRPGNLGRSYGQLGKMLSVIFHQEKQPTCILPARW